jgi:hypothetical protein
MFNYYCFFIVFVILANFGYGFGQIGKERTDVFSLPFFLTTLGISAICLTWIHKRWAAIQRKKEANQPPETTRGK